MLFLFLACLHPQQPASSTAPQTPIIDATSLKKPLPEILVSHPLPAEFTKSWPASDWRYAKAYAFNFVPYGPGNFHSIYADGRWNDKIKQSVDITREEAEYALALIHHIGGDIELSGCMFPRHGIVYFNSSDEPVASISYCFSCEGVRVWPEYLTNEEQSRRYDIMHPAPDENGYPSSLVVGIYEETQENWSSLFLDRLGLLSPSF